LKFAKQFWPGALTLVLPIRNTAKNRLVSDCQKGGKVAIRVSEHPIARTLSKELGRPIVSTSANQSGESDVYSIRTLKSQYKGLKLQPDLILDAGALPRRRPSTIVAINRNKFRILREGSIKLPKKSI